MLGTEASIAQCTPIHRQTSLPERRELISQGDGKGGGGEHLIKIPGLAPEQTAGICQTLADTSAQDIVRIQCVQFLAIISLKPVP